MGPLRAHAGLDWKPNPNPNPNGVIPLNWRMPWRSAAWRSLSSFMPSSSVAWRGRGTGSRGRGVVDGESWHLAPRAVYHTEDDFESYSSANA